MNTYQIVPGKKDISGITGSNLSLEMELIILPPKNSLCYTIECAIITNSQEKMVKIAIHDKAAIDKYKCYAVTLIQEGEENQEGIIIDTKEKIILTIP